jgi:protein-S-isoprenylcysteine O-methyltransferase Ste14
MKKLDFFGIGPKIGRIFIPWLVASIVISSISENFKLSEVRSSGLTISGVFLLVIGLIFYFSSARLLLRGLKEGKLVTAGTFSLCQNPLYISFILFLIPAIALLLNSWLVLTSGLAGFVLLKIYIGKEYQALEGFFGDEYLKYKNETPEFIPLPFKKWFGKK